MDLLKIEEKLAELLPGAKSFTKSGSNKCNFKTVWFEPNPEGVKQFNEIYQLVRDWKEAELTASKGISTKGKKFRYYRKALILTKSGCELVIVAPNGCYSVMFRSDYRNKGEGEEQGLSGRAAYKRLISMLKREGYDLEQEAITNGQEVKATIPPPDIRLLPEYENLTIEHTFHADVNSAYFAGIKEAYGQLGNGTFGKVIQEIFDNRKNKGSTGKYNKAILNHSQGFMQSEYCRINGHGYALAHISKAGIEYCRNRVAELIAHYQALGCKLIATNTDGAWFTIPKGVDEATLRAGSSTELGGWKIDHYDCKLRYKSRGAYEFIENGEYNVVVRGLTKLDGVKPRSKWVWGDIYNDKAEPIKYVFVKHTGFVDIETITI